MNVSLTPELEKLVSEKVRSGMYHTASEVIRDGLRLLKAQDELKQHRLEELRKDIAFGIEQADRGLIKPLDAEDLKQKLYKKMSEQKRR